MAIYFVFLLQLFVSTDFCFSSYHFTITLHLHHQLFSSDFNTVIDYLLSYYTIIKLSFGDFNARSHWVLINMSNSPKTTPNQVVPWSIYTTASKVSKVTPPHQLFFLLKNSAWLLLKFKMLQSNENPYAYLLIICSMN